MGFLAVFNTDNGKCVLFSPQYSYVKVDIVNINCDIDVSPQEDQHGQQSDIQKWRENIPRPGAHGTDTHGAVR